MDNSNLNENHQGKKMKSEEEAEADNSEHGPLRRSIRIQAAQSLNKAENEIHFSDTHFRALPVECLEALLNQCGIEGCYNLKETFPEAAILSYALKRVLPGKHASVDSLVLILDPHPFSREEGIEEMLPAGSPLEQLVSHASPGGFQASERNFVVPKARLLKFISLANLKITFPNVRTLKLLLRKFTSEWLAEAIQVMTTYSQELFSLQIIILNSLAGPFEIDRSRRRLFRLLTKLNTVGTFPALRHLLLILDDAFWLSLDMERRFPKVLIDQLEELHLYLPKGHANQFLERHLREIGESDRLAKFAFTTNQTVFDNWDQLAWASDEAVGKICHMHPSSCHLSHYPAMIYKMASFSTMSRFKFEVVVKADSSNNFYAEMLEGLQDLPNLKSLSIILHYHVNAAFRQENFQQLRLPSVTSLELAIGLNKKTTKGNFLNHNILSTLAVERHFPNLKSFSLFVSGQLCSLCRTQLYSADNLPCYRMLVAPIAHLGQLEAFEKLDGVSTPWWNSDALVTVNRQIVQAIRQRREAQEARQAEPGGQNEPGPI